MHFLHEGRPKVERQAVYSSTNGPFRAAVSSVARAAAKLDHTGVGHGRNAAEDVARLAQYRAASKEWVIRQYDHEVQGGSVIKPLVGVANDGPSDAAVLRPVLFAARDRRRLRHEPAVLATRSLSHGGQRAIDEAVRNCVAVGADPARSRSSTILLGLYRSARNAWRARAGGAWLALGTTVAVAFRHAVHQRQGQPEQRVQHAMSSCRRRAAHDPAFRHARCSSAPWARRSTTCRVRCVTMDLSKRAPLQRIRGSSSKCRRANKCNSKPRCTASHMLTLAK
jgi:hypothetical protein